MEEERGESPTNIFSTMFANSCMKGHYIHLYTSPFKVCLKVPFLSSYEREKVLKREKEGVLVAALPMVVAAATACAHSWVQQRTENAGVPG